MVEAIAGQAKDLIFYSTAADLPVRTRAAEGLVQFANSGEPSGLASVFFCNSGAEANENALKVAAQLTGRTRFAAFQGGWHGRTTLALSVTDDPKITVGLESFLAALRPAPAQRPGGPGRLRLRQDGGGDPGAGAEHVGDPAGPARIPAEAAGPHPGRAAAC